MTTHLRSQAHQAYLVAPPLGGEQSSRSPSLSATDVAASGHRRPLPVDRYGLLGGANAGSRPLERPCRAPAVHAADMEGLMQEIASVTDKILSGLEPV